MRRIYVSGGVISPRRREKMHTHEGRARRPPSPGTTPPSTAAALFLPFFLVRAAQSDNRTAEITEKCGSGSFCSRGVYIIAMREVYPGGFCGRLNFCLVGGVKVLMWRSL